MSISTWEGRSNIRHISRRDVAEICGDHCRSWAKWSIEQPARRHGKEGIPAWVLVAVAVTSIELV